MNLNSISDVPRRTPRSARHKIGLTIATMVAVGGLLVSSSAVATAAEPVGVDAVAAHVETAASVAGVAPASSGTDTLDVDIPSTAGGDVTVTKGEQLPLSIGTPDVKAETGEVAADGTTVFEGVGDSPDVSVAETNSGFRVSTVIGSESQPTEYTYTLDVDTVAELQADGSVYLLREEAFEVEGASGVVSVVVGTIEPAWAVDANQNPVATSYEVVDGAVIQHVEHSAEVSYPVVADPQVVVTGPLQARARWNKAETKTLKDSGWGAGVWTAACTAVGVAVFGAPGAAIGAVVCAAGATGLVYNAGVAYNSGRCLEWWVQFVPVGMGVAFNWYGNYTGGYCT